MTAQEQLRLMREVIAAVVNHLAAGGHIKRNDQFFKDLRKVHRETRELQHSPDTLTAEHWQNVACNLAFFAGVQQSRVHGSWAAVLDSLLEVGGAEITSVARTLAELLGVTLLESSDGGKSWAPAGEFRLQFEQLRDDDLVRELERRGRRFVEVAGLEPRWTARLAGVEMVHAVQDIYGTGERALCGAPGSPLVSRPPDNLAVTCPACLEAQRFIGAMESPVPEIAEEAYRDALGISPRLSRPPFICHEGHALEEFDTLALYRAHRSSRHPTLLDHLQRAEAATTPEVAAVIEQLAQRVPAEVCMHPAFVVVAGGARFQCTQCGYQARNAVRPRP